MADKLVFYQTQQPFIPLNNDVSQSRNAQRTVLPAKGKDCFSSILDKELDQVKFSQHALERIKSRNLQFSDQDLAKLNEAVGKIAAKGARESLVYLNDVALVVSVKNRTVITAMDGSSAKDNVFTNIDSAVIL